MFGLVYKSLILLLLNRLYIFVFNNKIRIIENSILLDNNSKLLNCPDVILNNNNDYIFK